VGFIIGLFYLLMETGSASEMFACNRKVEFNRPSRTAFLVTYLCLIMEAESAQKSIFLTKAR